MIKYLIHLIFLIITCNICYANSILNSNEIINKIILLIFCLCYTLIIIEDKVKIKKSTISIFFASIIWIFIALTFQEKGENELINYKIKDILNKYCELFLFLFTIITYVKIIKKIGIIDLIKKKLISNNTSYKKLFWITGLLAFFISPIADNLTTAIIVCSIIISIDKHNKNFINLTSINIVIAANAGGVFSPFGDITTLMIWQNNLIKFTSFFNIFIPSLINFLIPSLIISLKIENKNVDINTKETHFKNNTKIIVILLFFITIISTILIQIYVKMPSVIGIMFGFSLLNIFEYINNKKIYKNFVFKEIKNIDWDTLLFFYGIMLCIGSISITGIIENASNYIYYDMIKNINLEYKHAIANTLVGLISSIIDNIPITLALLEMNIHMSEGQWLLITLTTGTGGSLTSIGSSAGIALMGYTKGTYNFLSHLKLTWAILIGYIASIFTHLIINKQLFTNY